MNTLVADAWSIAVGRALFCANGSGDANATLHPRFASQSHEDAPHDTQQPRAKLSAIAGIPIPSLLERIRDSDQDALSILYKEFFLPLWRLAMLRTRAADVAEEAVHDVFLSLWVRRETVKTDTDIQVYLAAAVRNRTRDVQAHDRVVDTFEQSVANIPGDLPAMGQSLPDPNTNLEVDEFWIAYRRALSTLTEREREAVLLRWEEGFTLEQVGQVLGMSTMGARAAILRAQKKIQTELVDYRV